MSYFHQYKRTNLDSLIRFRMGETKLGELVDVPEEIPLQSFLEKTAASFVVLGIAEDIGVLANEGNAGTATAWNSFLRSFLNVQSNDFTKAHTLAVIGHFSFDLLKEKIEKNAVSPDVRLKEYRKAVAIIDDAVAEVIQLIVSYHKIPIVIGGGHNNAYPIIKGTATALLTADPAYANGINCVNLDAHVDYRVAEGRHSGNGFRYARQNGYLQKYFALGIHENYIPHSILNEIKDLDDIAFITYEDIFIHGRKIWTEALDDAVKFVKHDYAVGLELDMDSISYLPASAYTPCGVTSREALQYVAVLARHCKVAYLHICEGIGSNDQGLVGKLICYIVTTFTKTYHPKK